MPTATARENSTASMTGRPRATLITKIVTLSTPPTLASRPEKRVRPSWNSVCGMPFTESDGDPSELGGRPGRHDDRVGSPSCTTVPMNRHDDSSASGAPLATGAVDFSAGTDSPVRIDSSHSRLLAVRSRTSAGTIEPTPRCTMSPGTRCVTSTSTEAPSRVTATLWRISECIASAARSARYSLTNPRPTDAATITPMMRASSPSPTTADTAAAASSSHSSGLRNWRPRTDHALTWCERTAFGPNAFVSCRNLSRVSPTVDSRAAPRTIGLHGRGRLDGQFGSDVHRLHTVDHTQVWGCQPNGRIQGQVSADTGPPTRPIRPDAAESRRADVHACLRRLGGSVGSDRPCRSLFDRDSNLAVEGFNSADSQKRRRSRVGSTHRANPSGEPPRARSRLRPASAG